MNIQKFNALGHMQNSWLNAHYHFSFASYYNPKRLGFGDLLVINDDIIAAGSGFGMHGHDNMEIITYVRQGAITHEDSLGNKGITHAGDIQVMSAGTGIRHTEYNAEAVDTNLYQIWIQPNKQQVKPRWDAKTLDKTPIDEKLHLVVSGLEQHKVGAPLFIHANAAIYAGRLKSQTTIEHQLISGEKGGAYLLVSEGKVEVNGELLTKGDGAEITRTDNVNIKAIKDSEVLLIELLSV